MQGLLSPFSELTALHLSLLSSTLESVSEISLYFLASLVSSVLFLGKGELGLGAFSFCHLESYWSDLFVYLDASIKSVF